MPAIVTTDTAVLNSDAFKYLIESAPVYVFISGQTAWSNELSPPTPIDSTDIQNQSLADDIGIKRVGSSNIVSVLPRTNWISGVIYDQYDNQIDLVHTRNPSTGDFYRFYVLTDDFNVYKCLGNNYGVPSVNKPTGVAAASFQTPDGYVWKYMYSIHPTDIQTFMTVNWMPCYTLTYNDGSTQWASQDGAVGGSIENIVLTNRGSGYSTISPPTVTITGDGTGATAVANVNPVTGALNSISMTDAGSGYTKATVAIAGIGVGAAARALISPRYGHGKDPRRELGANYVMIFLELDGDEGGLFNTDTTYRINGIIANPTGTANGYAVKVGPGKSKLYAIDETLTGETSQATGKIEYVDVLNDILYIDTVTGTFTQNENVSSQTYNLTPILSISECKMPLTDSEYTADSFDKSSGQMLFTSFREKVTRLDQQKEDIISVIAF